MKLKMVAGRYNCYVDLGPTLETYRIVVFTPAHFTNMMNVFIFPCLFMCLLCTKRTFDEYLSGNIISDIPSNSVVDSQEFSKVVEEGSNIIESDEMEEESSYALPVEILNKISCCGGIDELLTMSSACNLIPSIDQLDPFINRLWQSDFSFKEIDIPERLKNILRLYPQFVEAKDIWRLEQMSALLASYLSSVCSIDGRIYEMAQYLKKTIFSSKSNLFVFPLKAIIQRPDLHPLLDEVEKLIKNEHSAESTQQQLIKDYENAVFLGAMTNDITDLMLQYIPKDTTFAIQAAVVLNKAPLAIKMLNEAESVDVLKDLAEAALEAAFCSDNKEAVDYSCKKGLLSPFVIIAIALRCRQLVVVKNLIDRHVPQKVDFLVMKELISIMSEAMGDDSSIILDLLKRYDWRNDLHLNEAVELIKHHELLLVPLLMLSHPTIFPSIIPFSMLNFMVRDFIKSDINYHFRKPDYFGVRIILSFYDEWGNFTYKTIAVAVSEVLYYHCTLGLPVVPIMAWQVPEICDEVADRLIAGIDTFNPKHLYEGVMFIIDGCSEEKRDLLRDYFDRLWVGHYIKTINEAVL